MGREESGDGEESNSPGRSSSGPGYSFPKAARLLDSAAFRRVFKRSRKNVTRHFVLHTRPNTMDSPRLGLTVSKKVGNAVVRNRIKRVTREFFRLHAGRFRRELDCVVIARHRAGTLPNALLFKELDRLFKSHLAPPGLSGRGIRATGGGKS